jgi:hypothetical protein
MVTVYCPVVVTARAGNGAVKTAASKRRRWWSGIAIEAFGFELNSQTRKYAGYIIYKAAVSEIVAVSVPVPVPVASKGELAK